MQDTLSTAVYVESKANVAKKNMADAAWKVADRAIQDNVASAGPVLLSALLSATGSRAAATQLLRTTLALAEERVEESVGPELQCVEAVEVQDEEEIDASFVDAVAVMATVQETGGMVVRQPKAKRKRCSVAESMTAAEARAQASCEGLGFVTSPTAASGFHNVAFDGRAGKSKPYAAYGQPNRRGFLGSYATAEEAALAYARHVGNTVERLCAQLGHDERTLKGLSERLTVVCNRVACGALVDLSRATIAARRRADGKNFAPGDGCANQGCAKRYHPKKFGDTQARMAKALLEGNRTLIAWPTGPCVSNKRRDLSLSVEETRTVAQTTLARFREE